MILGNLRVNEKMIVNLLVIVKMNTNIKGANVKRNGGTEKMKDLIEVILKTNKIQQSSGISIIDAIKGKSGLAAPGLCGCG